MKTLKTLLLAIAILFAGISASYAQFMTPESGASFSLKLFGAMPMGDFGNNSTLYTLAPSILNPTSAGNVDMGAGLGFKVEYQFNFGLGIFIGADAMWNQLNQEARTKYDALKKTKPNYINFPIMIGVDYQCYFGHVFGLYAEGALGANLMYVTPEGWSDNLTEFRLSTAFAWEAGGGILIGKHLSLGVHYYALGDHKIEIKDAPAILSTATSRMQKVDVLTFRLGLMF